MLYITRIPQVERTRGPDPPPEGALGSLSVEPGFLSRVHQGQQDATDVEMTRLWELARSSREGYVVRTVHALELLYRVGQGKSYRLAIPRGCR